jgi:hypothetical protein
MGASNVNDYLPNNNNKKSLININEFKEIHDLALHLVSLSKNETKYNEYLEWRNHPLELMKSPLANKLLKSSQSNDILNHLCNHHYYKL